MRCRGGGGEGCVEREGAAGGAVETGQQVGGRGGVGDGAGHGRAPPVHQHRFRDGAGGGDRGLVGEEREAAVGGGFGRPGAHAARQAVGQLKGHRGAGPSPPDAQPLADRVLAEQRVSLGLDQPLHHRGAQRQHGVFQPRPIAQAGLNSQGEAQIQGREAVAQTGGTVDVAEAFAAGRGPLPLVANRCRWRRGGTQHGPQGAALQSGPFEADRAGDRITGPGPQNRRDIEVFGADPCIPGILDQHCCPIKIAAPGEREGWRKRPRLGQPDRFWSGKRRPQTCCPAATTRRRGERLDGGIMRIQHSAARVPQFTPKLKPLPLAIHGGAWWGKPHTISR